jgi:hypothetical protein
MGQPFNISGTTSSIVNAVGESAAFIGELYLSTGPGTSKTISSAGGKLWFSTAVATWASAGTTLRVGIQDVNAATGVEDGTFDVFDDLVQGTDTLTSGAIKEVTLSSGTKTITHGDTIAVVVEMTVRNGTDSVSVSRINVLSDFPYCTADTGAGPAKATNLPFCAVQFDDGTIGCFGADTLPMTAGTQLFGSGSTPDEYALVFQVPFSCAINALGARLSQVTAGDDAVMALIANPLTSPTDLATATLTGALQGAIGAPAGFGLFELAETALAINTPYAIAYRPTTAPSRSLAILTLPHADVRQALPFGTTMQGATRTDLGAFTTSTTVMPDIGFRISQLDDGAGGGSSAAGAVAYIG